MNKTAISQRRLQRNIEANMIVSASLAEKFKLAIQQAISLGETGRDKKIQEIVSKMGPEKAKQVIQNAIQFFTAKTVNAATGDSGWAENRKEDITEEEPTEDISIRDVESNDEKVEEKPSQLKSLLATAGKWSILLLAIFLVFGALDQASYQHHVEKNSLMASWVKTFLTISGQAFFTWAVGKYLISKIK